MDGSLFFLKEAGTWSTEVWELSPSGGDCADPLGRLGMVAGHGGFVRRGGLYGPSLWFSAGEGCGGRSGVGLVLWQ